MDSLSDAGYFILAWGYLSAISSTFHIIIQQDAIKYAVDTSHLSPLSSAGGRGYSIHQVLGHVFTYSNTNPFVVNALQELHRSSKTPFLTSSLQSLIYRSGANIGSGTSQVSERTYVSQFEPSGSDRLVIVDQVWKISGRVISVQDTFNLEIKECGFDGQD